MSKVKTQHPVSRTMSATGGLPCPWTSRIWKEAQAGQVPWRVGAAPLGASAKRGLPVSGDAGSCPALGVCG